MKKKCNLSKIFVLFLFWTLNTYVDKTRLAALTLSLFWPETPGLTDIQSDSEHCHFCVFYECVQGEKNNKPIRKELESNAITDTVSWLFQKKW